MSETPITDAAAFYCGDQTVGEEVVSARVAREFEKNLTAYREVDADCRKLLGISDGNHSITGTIAALVSRANAPGKSTDTPPPSPGKV